MEAPGRSGGWEETVGEAVGSRGVKGARLGVPKSARG